MTTRRVLSGGAVAAIAVAGAFCFAALVLMVAYLVRKWRREAEQLTLCRMLWEKYGARGSPAVHATFPYHGAAYVRSMVPGQAAPLVAGDGSEFVYPLRGANADGNATDDEERRKVISMSEPINPDLIDPKLYSDDHLYPGVDWSSDQFEASKKKPGSTSTLRRLSRNARNFFGDDDDKEERQALLGNNDMQVPSVAAPALVQPYGAGNVAPLGSAGARQQPQLFFSIEYDRKMAQLTIFVDNARHLLSAASNANCNPYFTVTVRPFPSERRSRTVYFTQDPVFQQNFAFDVPSTSLMDATVQIKFFDHEQQAARDDCIGVVAQRLDALNRDKLEQSRVDLWRKIAAVDPTRSAGVARARCGDILIRLGYVPTEQKLTVVLLKARALAQVGADGDKRPPDPYIRVAIMSENSLLRKKKTSTKRRTCDPTYNQAVNFKVPLDLFPQIEIQFFVVHDGGEGSDAKERKEIIGYLEVSQHSTGDQQEHWRDLMSNRPQARWHRLAATPAAGRKRSVSSHSSPPHG